MADDFGLAGLDGPVGQAGPGRPDAELAVDAPGLGIPRVVGVVEDRDVRQIAAAIDLHRDVDPHRALALGARVALTRRVDDLGPHALAPRHAQEQAAVVVLADGHFGLRFTTPLEVEQEPAVLFAHRPPLGFGQDGVLRLVEQVVDRLPANLVAARLRDGERHSPPVVSLRVVEVVAAVHTRETPVEASLVLVVVGAEFGDHALAVGSRDRMEIRPGVGPGVLGQDRDRGGRFERRRGCPRVDPGG